MKLASYHAADELGEGLLDELVAIAAAYYPPALNMRAVVSAHIKEGGTFIVARSGSTVAGFSIASTSVMSTPFHAKPIPVIYQREMFVNPLFRGRHVGVNLQIATIRAALGPLWFARRFVLFCGTHNPLILRNFAFFSRAWPDSQGRSLQDDSGFTGKLLELMHGKTMDANMCVAGTFKQALAGVDYSRWWNRYLRSSYEPYNRIMLERIFSVQQDKLHHRGTTLLVIGYARPFVFVRRYLVVKWKALLRRLRRAQQPGN